MSIIYTYPTVTPASGDLVLLTDTSDSSKATKNATVSDLLSVGLMATIPTGLSLDNVHVLVEHVHAFPKQGAVSTFSLGQNLGQWEGTLYANELEFTYVNPKEWIYWYGVEKGLDKKERKRILLEKAKALFPNMKITFNVSDAMLIANYCAEMYYKNTYGG